jgi:hypothetical protein
MLGVNKLIQTLALGNNTHLLAVTLVVIFSVVVIAGMRIPLPVARVQNKAFCLPRSPDDEG